MAVQAVRVSWSTPGRVPAARARRIGRTGSVSDPMRETGTKVVASNRKARRNYEILDTIEAGIVLRGSEVKSLRDGKIQIAEAFARIDGGEIWLHQLTIAVYGYASAHSGHEETRKRKLLLHSHEIERLR